MPLTFDVLCCPVMSQTGPVEMPFSLYQTGCLVETWVAKLHYLSFIVNLILQIRKWLMNCSYIRIPCLFDTEDEYGDAVDDGDRFEDNVVGSGLTPTLQF